MIFNSNENTLSTNTGLGVGADSRRIMSTDGNVNSRSASQGIQSQNFRQIEEQDEGDAEQSRE